VLAGQLDEAAALAERLKALPTTSVAIAVAQAEALSFFGDDAAVLAAFARVQRLKGRDDDPNTSALLHHLAAVAALGQGQALAARRRWQKALELNPRLEIAAANLADLDRPEDERNVPWPYHIDSWLPRTTIDVMSRALDGQRGDAALTQAARRFLQRYPEVARIVPLLLARGDPFGREFAVRLAGLAQTPELLTALVTFAQSQAGPTQLRLQAVQFAQQGGALANGAVRYWQGGAWREAVMSAIEIHGEPPPHTLPPAIVALQREAALALRAGDARKAERLLTQALAQFPNDPSLLNNLGAAHGELGRHSEAEAIARQLVAEQPDYLFGITNLVPYLIAEGKLAQAQALLDPLLRRQRMHISEFGALAAAQADIFIAEGKFDDAERWLELWERADPEHPHVAHSWGKLRNAKRVSRRKR
jgi:tetratricopeptide (TPR) repeat protein